MIQSTLLMVAPTPAGVSSAVAASQSKARMPRGVLEPTKTRWRPGAAKPGSAAAARVAAEAVFINSRRERFFMVQAIIADGGAAAPVSEQDPTPCRTTECCHPIPRYAARGRFSTQRICSPRHKNFATSNLFTDEELTSGRRVADPPTVTLVEVATLRTPAQS